MPILLFTGPGGAGTTTLASGAAVRAARSGRSTLLLTRQAPATPELDDVDGLRTVRVTGQAALERLWGAHAATLSAALPLLTVPPPGSVPALPGMAELALLAEVAGAAADVVVVDGGPTESATALLALPEALRWWLENLVPARLRVLGALRAAGLDPQSPAREAADAALAGLAALQAGLERLGLADPSVTSVVLVAPTRAAAVPVLRATAGVLGLHGQRAAAVAVRAMAEGAGDWWVARAAEQDAAEAGLAEIGEVVRIPEQGSSPGDPDELAALVAGLPEEPAPAEPVAGPAPEKTPGGWRLSVPLPFAVRGDMELTRWADDLIVTVHGSRRSFRLDSLLRRCRVTGGTLAGAGTATARLEVAFAPDPQQWPADLLSAHERAAAEESG